MRDQFVGDISDLLKFSLLRALAASEKRLGIGWYFIKQQNTRRDGRHREFCHESKWKLLDEEVWKALKNLKKRSVDALEELRFWPDGTKFYRAPLNNNEDRQEWFRRMQRSHSRSNLLFLDPDNGLGDEDELHATTDEVRQIREPRRTIVLIKFPGRAAHHEQTNRYHKRLFEETGALSVFTIRTSVTIEIKTRNGKRQKVPRSRWFTVIDGDGELKKRGEVFVKKLNGIAGCNAELIEANKPSNMIFSAWKSQKSKKELENICPECGYQFRGSGFNGIDAHWKANHEHIMPYSIAWPLIRAGRYVLGEPTCTGLSISSLNSSDTPIELGYRMPAEWEPHEATWLAWPHNPEDWPGKFQPVPWVYAEIVRLLSAHERVHILVEDEKSQQRATSILERAGANLDQVAFHRWPTDRSWTRDTGPIFVRNSEGRVGITNWLFNAWAKYPNYKLDDQFPARVADLLNLPAWQPLVQSENSTKSRLVLEGGSIDTNGAGILLTTEECQLSKVQQRNPGISRAQLEQTFHHYLGIDQILWLNRGIAGDDTHGHVDDISRFVAPTTIVTAIEPNKSDPNHAPLAENLSRLRDARTTDGKPFELIELPMPRPVVFRGQRLPASYANFYIANGLVLVPTFHDPSDRIALNILAEVFPGREVIGIHSVDLVWGLGTLHCMTQQQPAALAL